TRVVFEHESEQPQESRIGPVVAHEVEPAAFLPRLRDKRGPLQPGEEREYYLPEETYDGVALMASSLPADRFWLAAYSGAEQVGRLGGEHVRPFFDRVNIVFH